MAFRIMIHRVAKKQFDALDKATKVRVEKAINEIAEDPFKAGKKLKSRTKDAYRVRVGDYRIAYVVMKKEIFILILRISDRKEVYQQLKDCGLL